MGAFVQRDYRLSAGVPGVAPVTDDTAAHIEKYIENYGEALVELPEETWDSSVCIWQGKCWDALVDLWTRAEGRSDLAKLAAFWLIVTGRTLHGAYHGNLFVSPCLSDGTGLDLPPMEPSTAG